MDIDIDGVSLFAGGVRPALGACARRATLESRSRGRAEVEEIGLAPRTPDDRSKCGAAPRDPVDFFVEPEPIVASQLVRRG